MLEDTRNLYALEKLWDIKHREEQKKLSNKTI